MQTSVPNEDKTITWYSISIIPIIIIILKEIRIMIVNIEDIVNHKLYSSAPISKFVPILYHDRDDVKFKSKKKGKIVEINNKIKSVLFA